MQESFVLGASVSCIQLGPAERIAILASIHIDVSYYALWLLQIETCTCLAEPTYNLGPPPCPPPLVPSCLCSSSRVLRMTQGDAIGRAGKYVTGTRNVSSYQLSSMTVVSSC